MRRFGLIVLATGLVLWAMNTALQAAPDGLPGKWWNDAKAWDDPGTPPGPIAHGPRCAA